MQRNSIRNYELGICVADAPRARRRGWNWPAAINPETTQCLRNLGLKITCYVREAGGKVLAIYGDDVKAVKANIDEDGCAGYHMGIFWLKEWHIYGNADYGRIAIVNPKNIDLLHGVAPTSTFSRHLGQKGYELKDHLGNVRIVMKDFRERTYPGPERLNLSLLSDYYAFGMQQPGRHWEESAYRYGFNGMERDDLIKETSDENHRIPKQKISGTGNSYDFGARFYDPRVGRFLSLDPMAQKFPWQSNYTL